MKREYIRFIIRSAKYIKKYMCHLFNYDWTNRVAFMYKYFYLYKCILFHIGADGLFNYEIFTSIIICKV